MANHSRIGEACWSEMPKVNSEIFSLTYGAFVTQIIRDENNINDVNARLLAVGKGMGGRMVDEFLARSGVQDCSNFKETAENISKVGFKMFLGVVAEVVDWNEDNTAFTLKIGDTPITDFVEVPEKYKDIKYSNIICGAMAGALEMVQLHVECSMLKDMLAGDEWNEIRVELKGVLEQTMADDYQE